MRYSQLLASACSWAFGAAEFIRVHSAFFYRNARYGCLEGPFLNRAHAANRRSRKQVLPGARARDRDSKNHAKKTKRASERETQKCAVIKSNGGAEITILTQYQI